MKEKGNYSGNNNKGRVVVVTGSSRGIGKSIAAEFANAGYSVVINARSEQELNQAAEEISKYSNDGGGKIVSMPGDVSQESVCISLIESYQRVWKD